MSIFPICLSIYGAWTSYGFYKGYTMKTEHLDKALLDSPETELVNFITKHKQFIAGCSLSLWYATPVLNFIPLYAELDMFRIKLQRLTHSQTELPQLVPSQTEVSELVLPETEVSQLVPHLKQN